MKKRLFSLSKTHASTGHIRINPLRRVRKGKKLSLGRPTRPILLLVLSVAFLLLCVVVYNMQDLLPKFNGRTEAIVIPNAPAPSLSLFNKQLKEKNIQFDTMRIATESPTIVVYLSSGAYAYLDMNTDAKAQVDLLSMILARINREPSVQKLKYVDLRYEKPIVKY